MNFVLVILGAILISAASSNAIPIDDSTTLEQLDDYSLLGIIDHLHYNDTLKLITTSKRFQNIVTQQLLENKYSERVFRFEIGGGVYWKHYDDEIILDSYESIMIALEKSGYLIKKLVFNSYRLDSAQITNISRGIEQYLSESLVAISLKNMYGDHLISMATRAFPKVTSVSLYGGIYPRNLRLYDIFPNMKEFDVALISNIPITSLNHHYEQLTHVTSFDKDDKNVNLRPLLLQNGQIRHLKLDPLPDLELLECIHESLPLLETLYLSCGHGGCAQNSGNGQIIHFEGVKKLEIHMGTYVVHTYPISFGNLRELFIRNFWFGDFPIRLIKENKDLRILSVPALASTENSTRILDALADLTKLEEVTFGWNKYNQKDCKYLMSHFEQLKIVSFIVDDKDERDILVTKVSDEWRLTNEETFYMLGEKIKLTYMQVDSFDTLAEISH